MPVTQSSDPGLRTEIQNTYARTDREVPDADGRLNPISITVDDSCCIERN